MEKAFFVRHRIDQAAGCPQSCETTAQPSWVDLREACTKTTALEEIAKHKTTYAYKRTRALRNARRTHTLYKS